MDGRLPSDRNGVRSDNGQMHDIVLKMLLFFRIAAVRL